jgi:fluoride exporter
MLYTVIALGGAFGAMSRFWITAAAERLYQGQFPLGTFAVNLLGAFLIGILFVIFTERVPSSDYLRSLLISGFLGAMTTFSAFSLEALLLLEQGLLATALAYIFLSVTACLLASWTAISLTRMLIL